MNYLEIMKAIDKINFYKMVHRSAKAIYRSIYDGKLENNTKQY